jgi:membrane-associated phospholipid phosphatase
MDRRILYWTGGIAGVLMLAGLLGLDRPLAEWVRASGIENAAFFRDGLALLDRASGLASRRIWWPAGLLVAGGVVWLAWRRDERAPRVLIATGLIDAAAIELMIRLKDLFGRLRPSEVLASGDWASVWFAGGGSFPSGHSAFYFGLFLPLAAACPQRWARAVLLAVPVYVVLARIDLARHFLSDVAASALMVAILAAIAGAASGNWLARGPRRASAGRIASAG